jgi:hypothetical protein
VGPRAPRPPEGLAWSLIPLVTIGLGAPASFLYAAVRRRSPALGAAAAGYGAGVVGTWLGFGSGSAAGVLLGMLLFVVTWWVSAAHALTARSRVYPRPDVRGQINEQVVAMARQRRSLREAARKIATEDPVLARELRIGRPDLMPRQFDDGGLIDVNHVPPEVLSRLPGLTYDMVERIVESRDRGGGFVSAEEVAVRCDLPPSVVADIAEYALFSR